MLPDRHARSEHRHPRQWDASYRLSSAGLGRPSTDDCASAIYPGRSPFFRAAFRSSAATSHLAMRSRSRVKVPGLRSPNDLEILPGCWSASLTTLRKLLLASAGSLTATYSAAWLNPGLSFRSRTFAPLWDSAILRPLDPAGLLRSVRFRLEKPAFANCPIFRHSPGQRRVSTPYAPAPHSGFATFRQARWSTVPLGTTYRMHPAVVKVNMKVASFNSPN